MNRISKWSSNCCGRGGRGTCLIMGGRKQPPRKDSEKWGSISLECERIPCDSSITHLWRHTLPTVSELWHHDNKNPMKGRKWPFLPIFYLFFFFRDKNRIGNGEIAIRRTQHKITDCKREPIMVYRFSSLWPKWVVSWEKLTYIKLYI